MALLAVLAWAGCEQDDDDGAERRSPARVVQGSLELERARAGAPDAGTRGGHGADRYVLRATEVNALVGGRVKPASARVELVDESGRRLARVLPAPDGRFLIEVPLDQRAPRRSINVVLNWPALLKR